MKFLAELLVGLLKFFIPTMIENSKDTMENSKADKKLRSRLVDRVRRYSGASLILLCLLCAGCKGTHFVYVERGDPIRLRQDICGVKVWVRDSEGKWVEAIGNLNNGDYVLYISEEEIESEE